MFKKKKYTVIRQAISKDLAGFIANYFSMQRQVYDTCKAARYFSPFDGFGFGGVAAAGLLGLGGFGGSMGYLMMPLNYDMQVIQAIEMNEQVRLSNYSFEIHNNVIRIFPIPGPYEISGVGDDVEHGQCGKK